MIALLAVLIVLGIALVLLYFWLIGHWFVRVILFLPSAVALSLAILVWTSEGRPNAQEWSVAIVAGVVIAWFVTGIPIYVHRYWRRNVSLALTLR